MAQIRLRGKIVNYETACAAPCGGECVVMLHGAGQSAACWERQTAALADYTRFPSLALDLPGHGGSGGAAMTSIGEYARFVADFCAETEIHSPIFIGHSMGGRIAQVLALGGALEPRACMLAGTGVRMRVSKWSLKTVGGEYETFCRTAARNAFSPSASPRLMEVFLKRLLASSKESCRADLVACDGFDTSASAGRIEIPAVVVAGARDVLTPAKHTNFLHRSIKGSKLFVIEDAGHFMMMEKPEEFNKIMLDFLNLL